VPRKIWGWCEYLYITHFIYTIFPNSVLLFLSDVFKQYYKWVLLSYMKSSMSFEVVQHWRTNHQLIFFIFPFGWLVFDLLPLNWCLIIWKYFTAVGVLGYSKCLWEAESHYWLHSVPYTYQRPIGKFVFEAPNWNCE
jgi:hypothetical protein